MSIVDNLQLAKTVAIKDVKYPCRAEIKTDGVRVFNIGNSWYTRKMKVVPLSNVGIETNVYHYDVEITLESGKMADRSTIIGMVNSIMKGGCVDQSKLRFNVFDSMLATHFDNVFCPDDLISRVHRTNNQVSMATDNRVRKVQYKDCFNLMQLEEYYTKVLDEGYEGLVIKYYQDMYKFKKSNHWGKLKAVRTADLKCVGTTDGKGKYDGHVGALMLEGSIDGTQVTVNVGSGMSAEDHYKDPSYYSGKTIEVAYSHVTQNKNSLVYSLNQPRFVCVRDDK